MTPTQLAEAPSRRRSPVVYGGHPYQIGPAILRSPSGKTYRLCSACGKPGNAPQHRASAIPSPAPAPISAAAARARRAGRARGSTIERHAYQPGGEPLQIAVKPATHRGRGWGGTHREIPTCSICGKARNGPMHRAAAPGGAPQLATPPSPAAIERRPALQPQGGVDPRIPVMAGPQPEPHAPAAARGKIAAPAAELALLAIAIDQALALPADALGYRLRLKLADLRPLVPVPALASLQATGHAIDPEAPSELLQEAIPALRPQPQPRAQTYTALRGIRDDRIRLLARRAIDQGWSARRTAGGHLALDRGEQTLILSATAKGSAGHSWGNARAQAKRMGIDVAGL